MTAEPLLYNINLKVVDCEFFGAIIVPFAVPAQSGQTLFEALTGFGQTQNEFKFKTKEGPNVGQYVVEVMGKSSGFNRYWEVLLVKDGGEVIPIDLDFKIFGFRDITLYCNTLGNCVCGPVTVCAPAVAKGKGK